MCQRGAAAAEPWSHSAWRSNKAAKDSIDVCCRSWLWRECSQCVRVHSIFYAAMRNQVHVAQWLHGHGAAATEKDVDRHTPLHCAAGAGHLAMVKYLVSIGAEVDAVNGSGLTPLRRAVQDGHVGTACVLL